MNTKPIDTVYRRAVWTSLLIGLICGAGGGTMLTLRLVDARTFTDIADSQSFIAEINAMAHALISGWMGLFLIACSYRVLPQYWRTTLPARSWCAPILALQSVGVLLRVAGELAAAFSGEITPLIKAVLASAACAEITAIAAFTAQVMVMAHARSPESQARARLAVTGCWFFFAATVFDAWHAWNTAHASGPAELVLVVSTWQPALRNLQVHGAAIFLLLALALGLFPPVTGRPALSSRRGWWVVVLLTAGVIGEAGFFLIYRLSHNHTFAALMLLAWLMLLLGVGLVTSPWAWWRMWRGADHPTALLRIGCAWLIASIAMYLAMRWYNVQLGRQFSHAYFAAIGQAVALGFTVQVVMALIARLSPTSTWTRAAAIIFNTGLLVHVTALIGTDWNDRWYEVLGVSGVVEGAALAWWIVLSLPRTPRDLPTNS